MPRPRKHNRHLPPCVYESHGAFYLAKHGRWEPLGRSLPAALAEYARRFDAGKAGGLGPFIDDAFARMRSRAARPLARSTIEQYTVAAGKLKHLLRDFAHPEQVKQRDAAMVKKLLAPTPSMANRVLSFARSAFAMFVEDQLIESNPFLGVRRHAEARRERLLTVEEFERIHAAAGPRLRVVMELAYLTGQRIGDVLAIRRADLLGEGIAFDQQKTGARLVVRWSPALRQTVERANALGGNVRALTLLYNRRGKAPDYKTVRAQWDAACRAAGVEDAHLHDLRAMAATAVGKDRAGALLGHRDARTTRIYLRGREVPVVEGPGELQKRA